MAKFDFLQGIEDDSKNPKQRFQIFEAELGFEKISIAVPFANADAFFDEAMAKKPKAASTLLSIAQKFGGYAK